MLCNTFAERNVNYIVSLKHSHHSTAKNGRTLLWRVIIIPEHKAADLHALPWRAMVRLVFERERRVYLDQFQRISLMY
jgi:hypothetical protein